MDKTLTPQEAWQDFLKWMESKQAAGDFGQMPGDVQEAKYAAEGNRRYPLGKIRIVNLLKKYAPDRYDVLERIILHE